VYYCSLVLSVNFVPATEIFRKNERDTRGKLSLQHVPALRPTTCPLECVSTSKSTHITHDCTFLDMLLNLLKKRLKHCERKNVPRRK